jgi:hypothetical protein
MKKMNAEKKRKIAGVIAIVLIASMLLSAIVPAFLYVANAAVNSSDYTVEANLGFNGMAKIGCNIPVGINITNNSSKQFSGEVALYVVGYDSESKYIKYTEKAEIAASGSKSVYFNVPINLIEKEMTIQLIDKKGVAFENTYPLSFSSDDDCWVGILSDNYDNVSYINPVIYAQGGCTVDLKDAFTMTRNTVPLDSFNLIVVDNFDMASLSDDYLYALRRCVSNGAMLIIGDDVQLGENSVFNTDDLTAVYDLSDYVAQSNAVDIGELCKYNEFYRLGQGYIVKTQLDLSDVLQVNSDVNFTSLLSAVCYSSAYNGDKSVFNGFVGYTNRLPDFTDNTIKLITSVLYLYIAMFPILYFVLKAKDKREDAIKIIPVAALAVSFIIYIISFNTVYRKPIASVINYIDLRSTDSDSARLISYMNVISPSKGNVNIVPEGNPEVLNIGDYAYQRYYTDMSNNNDINDDNIAAIVSNDNDGVSVQMKNKTKWDSTYLTLADRCTLNGDIDIEASVDDNGMIKGTVSNNTGVDFSRAVVIASSYNSIISAKKIDDFESGNSIDLSDYSIYVTDTENSSDYKTLINYYGTAANRNSNLDERYALELEQDILSDVCSELNSNGDMGMVKLTVLGFSEDGLYGSNTKVNKTKVEGHYTDIFRTEVNVPYPENSINGIGSSDETMEQNSHSYSDTSCIVESDNVLQYDEQMEIVYPEQAVELSFESDNYKQFIIDWEVSAKDIYIYNAESKQWEDLYCGVLYSDNNNYVSDGKIRIKAFNFNDDYVEYPTIKFID